MTCSSAQHWLRCGESEGQSKIVVFRSAKVRLSRDFRGAKGDYLRMIDFLGGVNLGYWVSRRISMDGSDVGPGRSSVILAGCREVVALFDG